MAKNFKTVKTSIITGILLVSIFASIIPITTAGPIFNLQSVLAVNWATNETQEPVVPRGELRQLTIVITHWVNRGALGALALAVYQGNTVVIQIEIMETSPWCTANLATGTVSSTIKPAGEPFDLTTQLSLQVEEDAPAYGLGFVKIRAKAQRAGLIEAYEQIFTLNFIPDYKPLIKPSLPETNTKEIGPMDTAVFPIEVENLGNARTVVLFNVVSVPNKWNAVINSQVILEEGEGSRATAYLVIRPPKDFGYHYDEGTIRISMQPVKADDFSKKGELTYESVLVQSRGFSTPGFEAILFVGALLVAFLVIKYKRKK